jgi:hypothetical protein
VSNQTPSIDVSAERLDQPLFGGATTAVEKLRAAVLDIGDKGIVLLDAGQLAGIAEGSEFTSLTADAAGNRITLRVVSLEGITYSKARIVAPLKTKIAVGQIFELTRWVPREVDALHLWTWPANLSQASLQDAIAAIRNSGAVLVEDPAEEPWTDMLAWNGAQWELRHTRRAEELRVEEARITALGSTLTADKLNRSLAADARLWANLPPPQELRARIDLHLKNSLAREAETPDAADYLLAGSLGSHGPQWAWYRKTAYLAGSRAAVTQDHTEGCSTDSPYPLRSDWVEMAASSTLPGGSAKLNEYASRLAKVNGWLNLTNSLSGASGSPHYRLLLKRTSDGSTLAAGKIVREGETLKMYLHAGERVVEKRWVYVLDIDCRGRGTLLYPYGTSDNEFPKNIDSPHEFELPNAPTLEIKPPFGMDSILLISTGEKIDDPAALSFEGANSRMAKGAATPLQQLLDNTSAGARGSLPEIPTDWSIDSITLQSVRK